MAAGVGGFPVGPGDTEHAAGVIAGRVVRTPTLAAPGLSAMTGADVTVKYETMQATGSFKERGALVKLAALSPEECRRGVIAMSAGNHAQAVAYHARMLGLAATIVMPEQTPHVKAENTRRHGATVVLKGATLAESQTEVEARIAAEGLTLVHPYDDPAIIAGQGTVAREMLADAPDLDMLVVPVGGGGLISGIAIAAKAIKPSIRIVGVEARLYPSFWNAIHGATLPLGGPTLAEGIAVKNVGRLTLPIVTALVDELVLVDEAELERAVAIYAGALRTMAEGAGAAGLAAMLARPELFAGRRVGLVLCGGNIDARLLASIMVRDLERAGRVLSFRLTTVDRPGLLGTIASRIGALGANILEVTHRRLFLNVPAKGVSIDLTVETRDRAHAEALIAALEADGLGPSLLDPRGIAGQG
jgi:threonine dehydratase